MHLGLGFYAGMGLDGIKLMPDHLKFARQCGATHMIGFLQHGEHGWAHGTTELGEWEGGILSKPRPERWTAEALSSMRQDMERYGLTFAAVENFEPADWYDVLLDGPTRNQQMDTLCTYIRAMGQAGIPVMSYNFSTAAVWGLTMQPVARGEALSTHYNDPVQTPIPQGMVWSGLLNAISFKALSNDTTELTLQDSTNTVNLSLTVVSV